MSNKPVPLTRADLTDAAWERYQASLKAFRAREALAEATKPFRAARDEYERAAAEAEKALRNFENVEQQLMRQETAPPVRAVAS